MPTPTVYQYDLATHFPNGISYDGLVKEIIESANISIQLVDVGKFVNTVTLVEYVNIEFADDLEEQTPDQLPLLEALFPDHDHTYVSPNQPKPIRVVNEDATIANFPQTTRKTPIFQPSIVPPGYLFYGTTHFDDIDSEEIGEGDHIEATSSILDDTIVVQGRFLEHVYILGGLISVWESSSKDWVSLDIVFPASTPAETPGTGNAIIAGGVFVPIQTGDGTHTVDGATLEGGEINQDLCPVPSSPEGTGFWNWDPEASPSITPSYDQTGNYHLIPAELTLIRQANKYPLKNHDVTPASGIQGKKVLPHWIWKFTFKRPNAAGTLSANITLYTARKRTR